MKKLLALVLFLAVIVNLVSCSLPNFSRSNKNDDTLKEDSNDAEKEENDDIIKEEKEEKYVRTKGVSLNESEITGYIGDTFTLTATVRPENATDKSVTWFSYDPTVANVTQDGEVTFKSYGKTKIYAKAADGQKAYCNITVEKKLEYFEKTITFGNYKDYLNVTIRKTSDAFVIHISPKFENYEYDVTFVYDITVTRMYETDSRPVTKHDIVKCYIGTYTKPLVGVYNDVDYTLTSISGIVSGYIEK